MRLIRLQYFFRAGYLVTIYSMKKLALSILLFLAVPAFSFAQIYTAGSGYYPQERSVVFPWEASLGLTGAFYPLEETDGERLLSLQGGFSARALYYLAPWVGLGVEGAWFFPSGGDSLVDKYKVLRGGVTGKFIAVSETSVRSYGVLAAGFTRRETAYSFGWSEYNNSAYFAFGFGVETDVADSVFIGVELRGIYNTSGDLGKFTRLVSRWETEGSVRLGLRF